MERSGNMYLLNGNEFIWGKFLNSRSGEVFPQEIPGPCMVRVEGEGDEEVGHVLSVQIGLGRGREYIVANSFEDVVFQKDNMK